MPGKQRTQGRCGVGGCADLRSVYPTGCELVDDVEFLAGLETYSLAGRDGDFGAGSRVAAYAGLAGLYSEDAKAAEFDAVALDQALFHRFEDGIDRRFGFGPDEPGTFDDTLNEILLDHFGLADIVQSIRFGMRLFAGAEAKNNRLPRSGRIFRNKWEWRDLLSSASVLLRW